MAKSKTTSKPMDLEPMDLFGARLEIESLQHLFKYIKTHTYHAEDNQKNLETYTTAIEAIAEMGIRQCEEAGRRLAVVRHG